MSATIFPFGVSGAAPTQVGAALTLTNDHDGITLECTTTLSITVPIGLRSGFMCRILTSGTTSFVSSGGTLLNGATTTVTRAAATAANTQVALIGLGSAANSYAITGA